MYAELLLQQQTTFYVVNCYSFNPESINLSVAAMYYIEADNNYCQLTFHYRNVKYRATLTHNLDYYEEKLKELGFIRIHHSYLINILQVERICFQEHYLLMKDDNQINYSKQASELIHQTFKRL